MSDRRLSEGPELRATITDQPNIAPVAEIFIAEAGLSDRVPRLQQMASLPRQPACRFNAAVVEKMVVLLQAIFAVRCGTPQRTPWKPDAFSSLGHLDDLARIATDKC